MSTKIVHRLPTREEYLNSDIFSRRDKLYFVEGCRNRYAGSFDTKREAEKWKS